MPAVYAGKPTDAENFQQTEANGLTVFVPRNAWIAPEGIKITLSGKGIWRRLDVQGLLG